MNPQLVRLYHHIWLIRLTTMAGSSPAILDYMWICPRSMDLQKASFMEQTGTITCLSRKPNMSQMVSCPEEGKKISTKSYITRTNVTPAPEGDGKKMYLQGSEPLLMAQESEKCFKGEMALVLRKEHIYCRKQVVFKTLPVSNMSQDGRPSHLAGRNQALGSTGKDESQSHKCQAGKSYLCFTEEGRRLRYVSVPTALRTILTTP